MIQKDEKLISKLEINFREKLRVEKLERDFEELKIKFKKIKEENKKLKKLLKNK